MAVPAATHVAAPLPLDVARDPDDDETATVAPATDTGVVIDTDPNPVTTDILADEHISLFLRHARRRAEDTVAGLVMDAAPPDTNTGVVVDPTPGVAAPVVAVGPTTDVDVGTAGGLLPGVADFDPTLAGSDHDEVTAAAPDGADFAPTSLGSAPTRGSDTTATGPIGTGRVIGGMSEGATAANDSDPISDWDGEDEVTSAVTTSSVTATRKRARRSKHSHVVRDERKRQRRAAPLSTTQSDTEAGT